MNISPKRNFYVSKKKNIEINQKRFRVMRSSFIQFLEAEGIFKSLKYEQFYSIGISIICHKVAKI